MRRVHQYYWEDKKRLLKLVIYSLYLLFLKYKVWGLLKDYLKLIFKMSPMKMIKALYNIFIITLLIELGCEEY